MQKAMIFGTENELTAEDVAAGIYDRHEEFVDPEYNFRVLFVSKAKNNGRPHFRIYLSRDEYAALSTERRSKYDYLSKLRHFQESQWHYDWENAFSFCKLEHYFRDSNGNRKRADVFYEEKNIILEFQHSYIDTDFEERNAFYKSLGKTIVWLFDLHCSKVVENSDGAVDILEDNAIGFFRVAENPDNLKDNIVFIQPKHGMIYRVNALHRRESNHPNKSTIRYFDKHEVFTEEEFINYIKAGADTYKSLDDLWSPTFKAMIAKNKDGKTIKVIHNGKGGIYRDNRTGCIRYQNVIDGRQYTDYHFIPLKDTDTPKWRIAYFEELR